MADEDQAAGGEQTETRGSDWRLLEKRAKDAERERDALREQVVGYRSNAVQQAVAGAGFALTDAEGRPTPVSLLVEKFESTLGDDIPTADAFMALAGSYGLVGAGQVSPGAAQEPTLADRIAAMQAAGNQVIAVGGLPSPPAELKTQIAEAEAAGDVNRSIALKSQMLTPGR